MNDRPLTIGDMSVPRFLYGTAWKEERTQGLVELALHQGFRGIDTANQRRHYHEAAVGQGIAAAVASGVVRREELFIQTKFTFRRGQDHRLPYDPDAAIEMQVSQSFASSLEHLRTDYVDSLVLHGPMYSEGLADEDWLAWRSMEVIAQSGRARLLGVSNFSPQQLLLLCEEADVPPSFVQNRCFASQGWDRQMRDVCLTRDITYQAFSLLTANPQVLQHPEVSRMAQRYQVTIPEIVFRFAREVNMIPLTGTSRAEHMQADLGIFRFRLETDEVDFIESSWG